MQAVHWPIDASEAKKWLQGKRSFASPFTRSEVDLIDHLSCSSQGVSWLSRAGLLSETRMKFLLLKSDFRNFMAMPSLQRLELACFAWFENKDYAKGSRSNVASFRNPAFLLGRALHLSDTSRLDMEQDLRDVWQQTFSSPHRLSLEHTALSMFETNQEALSIMARLRQR